MTKHTFLHVIDKTDRQCEKNKVKKNVKKTIHQNGTLCILDIIFHSDEFGIYICRLILIFRKLKWFPKWKGLSAFLPACQSHCLPDNLSACQPAYPASLPASLLLNLTDYPTTCHHICLSYCSASASQPASLSAHLENKYSKSSKD